MVSTTESQLSLFSTPSSGEFLHDALIPIGGFPPGSDLRACVSKWLAAMEDVSRRNGDAFREAFRLRGSSHAWFSSWNPSSQSMIDLQDALDCAYDVIETHFPPILARGMNHSVDMGLLASMGYGKSEGIMAKTAPYSSGIVHLEIHCVTGPVNFSAGEGVEFEPGAKSHVFHLAYTELPSLETLLSDICAYPMIRLPENRLYSPSGRSLVYRSEGFTGGVLARDGVPCHKTWDSLSADEQKSLMTLLS